MLQAVKSTLIDKNPTKKNPPPDRTIHPQEAKQLTTVPWLETSLAASAGLVAIHSPVLIELPRSQRQALARGELKQGGNERDTQPVQTGK